MFTINSDAYKMKTAQLIERDDYSLTLLTTDEFNTAIAESGTFCISSNLSVCGLNLLNTNQTTAIFEFIITNVLNNTQEDINWTLDTGDTNITSTFNFNLTGYEDIFVYVAYNYGSSGNYQIIATASNMNFTDMQSINVII